jgi:cytosine/adenosine deaminase-related metal-dependent hydrolase
MASLLVRAAWVCPVHAAPLADGWVLVADGRIAAVGQGRTAPPADDQRHLGEAILLPGLVNAHTHLELSWLRGRVPPAGDFLAWVAGLMRQRTRLEDPADAAVMQPLRDAVAELQACGTAAVGDVANALVSPAVLREAGVPAVVFHELIGFRDADGRTAVAASRTRRDTLSGGGVRVVPAPHAPFSVSPELFTAIRDEARAATPPITSVHVGESPEEVQLLRDGTGPWRTRLEELGAWRAGWTPPGRGPGDYLCDLGVIGAGTLVVHGVQLTDVELVRIAGAGATLVTCPRSNVWVGVGVPPVARFFASGARVALGTDSLASCPDLNLFAELAALRAAAPEVPARRFLEAATLNGAAALGIGDRLGSLQPGRHAHLVAVTVPGTVRDPEETLVAGVQPRQVQVLRLDAATERRH